MALLQKTFPGHVISRCGNTKLATKTFLWAYAKDRVYADKPSKLEHLKTNIRKVMAEIPPNMCRKKWSEIRSKESMLATIRKEVI